MIDFAEKARIITEADNTLNVILSKNMIHLNSMRKLVN